MPVRGTTILATLRGCGSISVKTSTLNCKADDSLSSSLPMAMWIFAMPFRRLSMLKFGLRRDLVRLGRGRKVAANGRSEIERT
jgi:hypothetical protein